MKDFEVRLDLFVDELNALEEKYQIALETADENGATFVPLKDRQIKFAIRHRIKELEQELCTRKPSHG